MMSLKRYLSEEHTLKSIVNNSDHGVNGSMAVMPLVCVRTAMVVV